MSDDEDVKKDKTTKPEEPEVNTPEETNEEPKKEEVEETKNEEVKEETSEPTVEESKEEPVEEPQEEKTETKVEEPVVEEPVVEASAVEENPIDTKTEETPVNDVFAPDQVVDNNNNQTTNNTNNSNNNNTNAEQPKQPTNNGKKTAAIWALVLSILGLFPILGGLWVLIALILSIVVLAKKKNGKGLAIAALIISIIDIIINVLVGLIVIPLIGIPALLAYGIYQNQDYIEEASKDLYNSAYNVIEDVKSDYDLENYVNDFVNTVSNNIDTNTLTINTDADTHNALFEKSLGTNMSNISVNALLIGIKANNITTTKAQKIGVCFIRDKSAKTTTAANTTNSTNTTNTTTSSNTTNTVSTTTAKEEYLAYLSSLPTESEIDDLYFTCNSDDLTAISKLLSSDKKYTVKLANEEEYTSTSAKDTGFKDGITKGSTGGLYDSGYYRLIYIYEN